MNQYEKAIVEVCNVMMPYAYNGQFKAYGFSGMPIYTGVQHVSRCWNLNGQAEAGVIGTKGVVEAYHRAIYGTKLAGPTYFEDFLNTVKNDMIGNLQRDGVKGNKVYNLLILVTDGNCHDLEMTKKLLIDMSMMPFSAVIVGVGASDFEDMEVLDADECVLTDNTGREAVRDIVQLVKYKDFAELGMRELALEVLGEVPDQFVDYMTMLDTDHPKLFYPDVKPTPTGIDLDVPIEERTEEEIGTPIKIEEQEKKGDGVMPDTTKLVELV